MAAARKKTLSLPKPFQPDIFRIAQSERSLVRDGHGIAIEDRCSSAADAPGEDAHA